ncbi:MAG: ribonuclease BN [Acidobacteria bacterium]|nr:MAG: ribonuclease BN [Acidobacteriota bacterium]
MAEFAWMTRRKWMDLARRVCSETVKDDVFGSAAKLAYYNFLALFPLLLFLTTLLGLVAHEGSALRARLLAYLATVVPSTASSLVYQIVDEVGQGASGGKLSFGLMGALWAAANGTGALIGALNRAYGAAESRPWWRAKLVALGLTVGLSLLIVSALALALWGEHVAEAIALRFRLGDSFVAACSVVQWPVVLAFVLLALNLIYYFAPNTPRRRWQWISPGAVAGLGLWLLASFGLRLYLQGFNTFSSTYGSLGAVIVLMLWFYLSSAAILIGGEINAELRELEEAPRR